MSATRSSPPPRITRDVDLIVEVATPGDPVSVSTGLQLGKVRSMANLVTSLARIPEFHAPLRWV